MNTFTFQYEGCSQTQPQVCHDLNDATCALIQLLLLKYSVETGGLIPKKNLGLEEFREDSSEARAPCEHINQLI